MRYWDKMFDIKLLANDGEVDISSRSWLVIPLSLAFQLLDLTNGWDVNRFISATMWSPHMKRSALGQTPSLQGPRSIQLRSTSSSNDRTPNTLKTKTRFAAANRPYTRVRTYLVLPLGCRTGDQSPLVPACSHN